MEDLKLIIADNIANLRKKSNYTQLELAEKLNYSDKSISKWERGESIPDVAVLKEIADLFGVTLDYMVQKEHQKVAETRPEKSHKIYNRGFITGMSIILVWLLATATFVLLDIFTESSMVYLLSFLYAVPISMVVWLVMNTIWFNRRRNFLIISLLMWSVLLALYLTFLPFNLWKIFVLGIPGQIIIIMWSRLHLRKKK